MDGYASMILSLLFGMPMDQEKFDKMFDEGFIKYFRDNPNGYDEVMKSVEQVPEDIREGIRERFNKLYEQAKKGGLIMIATTIEQSKHLLELGLDPKTADMVWMGIYYAAGGYRLEVLHREVFEEIGEEDIPAWSLSALLKVMPKNTNETYHLFSSMMADQLGSWVCDRSKYYMGADGHNKNDYECFKSNSPVTAAYEMVCWLLEQGLIKKGDNNESKD
jgi:hypothetical protein